VDKGDVFSILAALIVVSVVALVFRPPVAEAGPEIPESLTPTPTVTATPIPAYRHRPRRSNPRGSPM